MLRLHSPCTADPCWLWGESVKLLLACITVSKTTRACFGGGVKSPWSFDWKPIETHDAKSTSNLWMPRSPKLCPRNDNLSTNLGRKLHPFYPSNISLKPPILAGLQSLEGSNPRFRIFLLRAFCENFETILVFTFSCCVYFGEIPKYENNSLPTLS